MFTMDDYREGDYVKAVDPIQQAPGKVLSLDEDAELVQVRFEDEGDHIEPDELDPGDLEPLGCYASKCPDTATTRVDGTGAAEGSKAYYCDRHAG